ncbi:uncharacterized protein LOC117176643 [Belonocnema kinseyi]|uniref:uncharacterized protein LOC117176643 n=1 Tax=Belonocnema kinseyi TaxID=2817044 RepID=UPI00143D04B0|nr:uncharacterized protein LOC117176643 [Belonocnema kinseyi]
MHWDLRLKAGLRAYLATHYEGRLALKSGKNLNNTSRTHLVRSVVDYLFKYFSCNNKINTQIFRKAAAEIVEEYPNERATVYFVPSKPKTKFSSRTFNNGKLFNRYQKVQRKLGGSVIEVDADFVQSTEDVEESGRLPAENSTTAYKHLQRNVGSFEEQKENWRLCFAEREEFLRTNYIFEYIKLFPVLRVQFGYKLLLQDFDQKYPEKKNALYTVWKHLASAVIKFGINRRHLEGTVLQNSRDAVVVKYFPTIFHPGTVRNKSTNSNFRPSSTELGETFFLHIKKMAELDYEIERRTNIVSDRGDTLQPFIIAVGNTFETIDSVYVYVDGMRYLMDSIVQAVDVCFKIYQALNAAYPTTGQQIWNFIQRYVYKIHTCTDVESASQAEIAVDLCFLEPALREYLWDGSELSTERRHQKA